MFDFELGAQVRDAVTGQEGTICCREEWLNGCHRYGIQPQMDKDGKVPDMRWIDEGQLTVLPEAGITTLKRRTGGPQPTPAPMCGK